MPHLILARFGPHHRTAADANKKKAKATAEAKEEQSTLLDDTLKCAICFDQGEEGGVGADLGHSQDLREDIAEQSFHGVVGRPITVRGNAGLLRLVGS